MNPNLPPPIVISKIYHYAITHLTTLTQTTKFSKDELVGKAHSQVHYQNKSHSRAAPNSGQAPIQGPWQHQILVMRPSEGLTVHNDCVNSNDHTKKNQQALMKMLEPAQNHKMISIARKSDYRLNIATNLWEVSFALCRFHETKDTIVYIIHNVTLAIWRKCELITQVSESEFWMIIEFPWLRFLEFQSAPTLLKLQNHRHRTSSFSTFQQYQKCASISLKFLVWTWLNFQWKNCSILFK